MLIVVISCIFYFFFFFNDTATTEIYTLSLHDALPTSLAWVPRAVTVRLAKTRRNPREDRSGARSGRSPGRPAGFPLAGSPAAGSPSDTRPTVTSPARGARRVFLPGWRPR